MISIPTEGEEYAKLIEYLRLAQEAAAMLAHLTADHRRSRAIGWIAVSEQLKLAQLAVTKLATGRLQ